MADIMVRVDGLKKSYGDKVAVDGISFEIRRGEIFGLLGPNGAGKTTTIHMIASVLKPDAGDVRFSPPSRPAGSPGESGKTNTGENPVGVPGSSFLGIAPQSLAIYEGLTGEENVRFFGRLQGLKGNRLRERVEWALDFTGLSGRKKDGAGTYSGGMKRRLNLACAIVHDPHFILLDEPTVGVDPQSRNHLFDNIEALRDQGKTVLYTTHYMEEAQRLCDRVAIMDHGKLLALDSVDGLVEAHGGPSYIVLELAGETDSDALRARLVEKGFGQSGSLEVDGSQLRIETGDPLGDISRLAGSNLGIRSFRLERPNLEAVFLNLTGRTLRD